MAKPRIGKKAAVTPISQDRECSVIFVLFFVSVHMIAGSYDLVFFLIHHGHSVGFSDAEIL